MMGPAMGVLGDIFVGAPQTGSVAEAHDVPREALATSRRRSTRGKAASSGADNGEEVQQREKNTVYTTAQKFAARITLNK